MARRERAKKPKQNVGRQNTTQKAKKKGSATQFTQKPG